MMQSELVNALLAGDFGRATELLCCGIDVNALESNGDTVLGYVISAYEGAWEGITSEDRQRMVRWLLDHGVDLTIRDDSGVGPLSLAVWNLKVEILRMLLDAGADPNSEWADEESLYDSAEFDYRYHLYELDLPEQPTNADQANEEAWLQFLDRLAIKFGHPRPQILLMLRERGAKTSSELRSLQQPSENAVSDNPLGHHSEHHT